jgi:hypothetical protein
VTRKPTTLTVVSTLPLGTMICQGYEDAFPWVQPQVSPHFFTCVSAGISQKSQSECKVSPHV